MSEYDDGFFEGKREWSIIKDKVLSSYIEPYINKVKELGRLIVLIDAYAGPGVFRDGSKGSPMIMCSAAEKWAKGSYKAFFFNLNREYHNKLEKVIAEEGWSQSAICMQGNSLKHINQLPQILRDSTVFLYLDPFGLKGCGFDQLEPFLKRDASYSTEIVLTICMPVLHRLASYKAFKDGRENEKVKQYHQVLTTVLGDDSWKEVMLKDGEAREKEKAFIEIYLNKIRKYMPYTGSCPVEDGKRLKYFIVFASRHPDTLLLMNDAMTKAYFEELHKKMYQKTLFESLPWQDVPTTKDRTVENLNRIILELVERYPGMTRQDVWFHLVQEHFMNFTHSEYRDALAVLSDEKKILYEVDPKTKRHNKNSRLYPVPKSN